MQWIGAEQGRTPIRSFADPTLADDSGLQMLPLITSKADSADYTGETVNRRPCYRRNLTPPLSTVGPIGCARTRAMAALVAAVFCGLCLTACSKSAAQYIDRGNKLFAAGQYADATLNYRNAIQKRPDSGEAYYRLGLALVKQNQLVEAYRAFSQAVPLDAKNIPAKVQLGILSLAIYTRDPKHPALLYDQAKSMSDQLLGPGGDRAEGLRLKGALALIDNHPGAAVDALREAARVAPDKADAAGELAQALLRDNQPEEAEKTARDAVQRFPAYNQAYEILYLMYVSRQNWDKAEALLKLWGANNPKKSAPVLRLAAFYYARKQPDDAEKTLQSLLNRRAQFPQADLLVGDFHAMIHDPQKALADYQRGEAQDNRKQVYQQRVASALATLDGGKKP